MKETTRSSLDASLNFAAVEINDNARIPTMSKELIMNIFLLVVFLFGKKALKNFSANFVT